MTAPVSRPVTLASRLVRPALLAAAVSVLSGCAGVMLGGSPGPERGPGAVLSPQGVVLTPAVVRVGVSVTGTPVVTQEPAVVRAGTPGAITWQLPPDSGLTFPENGIVIEGQVIQPTDADLKRFGEAGKPREYVVSLDKGQKVITGCKRVSPIEFTCSNAGTPGRFAYTVRLLRGGQALEPLDPTVVNRF